MGTEASKLSLDPKVPPEVEMESYYLKKTTKFIRVWGVLLILLVGGSYGCQTKEPPLSPAAANFKAEVKKSINLVSKPLAELVVKKDKAAIGETLKKIEPEAVKLCRMCPFRMGVLDNQGNTLAVYPPKKNTQLDFYRYDVVQQALRERKIARKRLFLQNGSSLYIICAPLLQGDRVVGILALALSAADAQSRWGLTEKEFVVLDFNR